MVWENVNKQLARHNIPEEKAENTKKEKYPISNAPLSFTFQQQPPSGILNPDLILLNCYGNHHQMYPSEKPA